MYRLRQIETKTVGLIVVSLITLSLLIFSIVPSSQRDVVLPESDQTGKYSLNSVMRGQTISEYLFSTNITVEEISQILWGMQGITRGSGFRTAPSASAISPLELYVVHNGISNLDKGVYRYLPEQNGLEIISSKGTFPVELVNESPLFLNMVSKIETFVLITGTYDQTVQSYGERGYLYVDLEVGHVINNAVLQMSTLNLTTRPIYDFEKQEIEQFFSISEQVFSILPVGTIDNYNLDNAEHQGQKTFEKALSGRRSTRDYLDGYIRFNDFTELINSSFNNQFSQSITEYIEFYLVTEKIEKLDPGTYYINSRQNSFDRSSFIFQHNQIGLLDLQRATISGSMIGRAQAAIIVSLNQTYLNSIQNNSILLRLESYKIGMITQNLLIKCSELGLGTVSVGGFNPSDIVNVIGNNGDIQPVYILPIGIIAEYLGSITKLELTIVANYYGFIANGLFVLIGISTLKPIKRYFGKKYKLVHLTVGLVVLVLINMHYIIMHGYVEKLIDLINPINYIMGFINLVRHGFRIPLGMPDGGHFSANLAIIMIDVSSLLGILMSFKRVKRKRTMKKIHKYCVNMTLFFMFFHIFTNSISIGNNPIMFLFLNLFLLEVYLIARLLIRQFQGLV